MECVGILQHFGWIKHQTNQNAGIYEYKDFKISLAILINGAWSVIFLAYKEKGGPFFSLFGPNTLAFIPNVLSKFDKKVLHFTTW